ncbi:MAG: helix-turn-helix transcriptional regulator [Erysipelotrichaceae bacterium]|nr:helix-turn-helix transcriptional regulator [Erysipelotrichaceae bacterium]
MDFHNKLRELRKNKNITQEELASKLFVTRTAVSKWESGKGYPSIETLKDIANFYEVSIDSLLSNDELVNYSINSIKREKTILLTLLYGLIDVSILLMLFIPFFGQVSEDSYISVSLANLNVSLFVIILYYSSIISLCLIGVISLSFFLYGNAKESNVMIKISLIVTVFLIALFMATKQPYAGIYALVIGVIKGLLYLKNRK